MRWTAAGIVQLNLPAGTAAGTNVTLLYAEALAHPGLANAAAADAWNNGGGGDVYLHLRCTIIVKTFFLQRLEFTVIYHMLCNFL